MHPDATSAPITLPQTLVDEAALSELHHALLKQVQHVCAFAGCWEFSTSVCGFHFCSSLAWKENSFTGSENSTVNKEKEHLWGM